MPGRRRTEGMRRIAELFAMLMIGEGSAHLDSPEKTLSLGIWPRGYKRVIEALAEHANPTRLVAEAGLGLWLAFGGVFAGGGVSAGRGAWRGLDPVES